MDYRPDEKHLCAHLIRDPLVAFNVLDRDTLMTSLRSGRPLVLEWKWLKKEEGKKHADDARCATYPWPRKNRNVLLKTK